MLILDLLPLFHRFALYEKGLTPSSIRAIQNSVRRLCTHAHCIRLTDCSSSSIRAFLYHGRAELQWSAKTFRNHRQYLDSFFGWCVSAQYLTANPVALIEKPKVPKALPRFLAKDELEKILAQLYLFPWKSMFEQVRNESIIYTFLLSGVRLRELLHLSVSDINLPEARLFVRQGKGSKDRIVPIHPTLGIRLKRYLAIKKQIGNDSPWLFTGLSSQKRLWPKDIHRICLKVSKASGVKFTPHQLRHTLGRLSIEANLNPYKLKEILGHADINTTMIYASVSQQGVQASFSDLKLL